MPGKRLGLLDSLLQFDPDLLPGPAVALQVDVLEDTYDLPLHAHRRGQLILALKGFVTCDLVDGVWLVPPRHALWIPSRKPHRSKVSANGKICFLYIEPGIAVFPDVTCTLMTTPLIHELISHLLQYEQNYDVTSPISRLATVLVEQLAEMPTEQFHLSMSANERLRKIADALFLDPADRSTISEWAPRVALSERSFARLVKAETGMSFGQWRHQFQIIAALKWLSEGRSVQAVSLNLGYESVSAFITMFKKILGKSPGFYLPRRPGNL